MNQISSIGFGTDINVFAGYAQSAGDRLGAIDLVCENTGSSTAVVQVKEYDSDTAPSGWANVGTPFVVVPGGTETKHFNLLSKRVAFFGSGNSTVSTVYNALTGTVQGAKVNISTVIRNKADLRGAQIDIVAVGRKSWGYDEGWNKLELKKKWGSLGGNGNLDPSVEGV